MNKFIESDIDNGVKQLKVAIMNIIHAVIRGDCEEYSIEKHIPMSLLISCLEELGYFANVINYSIDYKIKGMSDNKCIIIIRHHVFTGKTNFKLNEESN